jgi:hypothetical protein
MTLRCYADDHRTRQAAKSRFQVLAILAGFVVTLLTTIAAQAAPVESNYRRSGRSGTSDDARASISCASNEILTGCECYSPWGSCDGALATGNKCIAQNKVRGDGVYAEALCVAVPDGVDHEVKLGGWSGSSDDAESIATCDSSAPILTGCTCFSNWEGCDGAKAIPDTQSCQAFNGNTSSASGVMAVALCAEIRPNPDDVLTREGPRSGGGDDDQSTASCPSGYTLTGCSCWSPWQSCDGARPKRSGENSCTAYNKIRGDGVYAEAQCVDFSNRGCTNACGGISPSGCFCDADCEDFGDCCTDYAQQCG